MSEFYNSEWFLPSVVLAIGLAAEVVRHVIARRDRRTAVSAVARSRRCRRMALSAMPQQEVDARFPFIVARLRDEADQRICEAHERNLAELPEIDGSTS